jgi:methyl-galactoside transport system substrate-binding protein
VRATITILLCSAVLTLGLASCAPGVKDKPRIGAVLRSFDEERSSSLRKALETAALDKADLSLLDGQGQSAAQGLQVKTLFSDKKLASLALEPVDSGTIGDTITQAKELGIPLVLFGVLPSEDLMRSWDKVFFVGTRDQDSGQAQGELIAASWKANPLLDRNKDKVLQYAIVGVEDEKGPRAEGFVKALAAAGIKAESVGAVVDASTLTKLGAKVEVAICVDLASTLGTIDYYSAAVKAKRAPLIAGASAQGLPDSVKAAIGSGLLVGMATTDDSRIGAAVFGLAYALGRKVNPAKSGIVVSDAKYVWIPCKKITKGGQASTGK